MEEHKIAQIALKAAKVRKVQRVSFMFLGIAKQLSG